MSFTLATIVREHVSKTPDAPALTFECATLSFAELDERSSRVANALMDIGVKGGDRVAFLSRNTSEFYEIVFACSKIGAVLVGLNWRLAPSEIGAIVADCKPCVMIVAEGEQHLLNEDARRSLGGRRVVTLGSEYEDWRAAGARLDPGVSGQADEVALMVYTSGTTGEPKGVMLTNAGMSYMSRVGAEIWGMGRGSVNLVVMPMFHIGGIQCGLSTMAQGGHTVLMREVDTRAIIEIVATFGVTHSFFVPAVIQALLSTPGVEAADLSSLELLSYGASPIGEAVLRRAIEVFGCGFMHVYGLTEASGAVAALPPKDHDPGGKNSYLLRSCGRALPWVDLRVIDPTTHMDVAPGAVGEIWVKSGLVTKGYWNNPAATAEAITPDGWLRTGDAAYQDEAGNVYIVDRFKDMIVSGGENVYPAEVENVLYGHPAIVEVAVIGVPSKRWGETVKAIVVLRCGQQLLASELIKFARTRLGKYKCPTSVEFVDSLPRNASGKVLKRELRQEYGAVDADEN